MSEKKKTRRPETCAIYARSRSGERNAEVQIANCRSEASQKSWSVADDQVYRDDGFFGRKTIAERPGFGAMLIAARKGALDVVIVDQLLCFSRKIEEVLKVYGTLSRLGVRIHIASPGPTPGARRSRKADPKRVGHSVHLGTHRRPNKAVYEQSQSIRSIPLPKDSLHGYRRNII